MSAPTFITVVRCDCNSCKTSPRNPPHFWRCQICRRESIGDPTLAAAADAGRAHLAECHAPTRIYCRAHGCHKDECGCDLSRIRSEAARPSDFVSTKSRGSSDLTTHNAVQDAHNLSRSDA